ncbi:MAG: hypothetical protein HFI69_09720 [Lachnospiraceae bacterium]|nr:hypothetical protein [Lachnospiraceae bacterium]
MKDKKRSYYLVFIMPVLYALAAYGVAKLVQNNGIVPSGMDTLCHLYKGDVLYRSISEGNWFPLFDPLWYNGVEMMRCQEPLPMYLLAFFQFLGGSSMNAYLIFTAVIFFTGAVLWFFLGYKLERPWLGAFSGILWFFMPNNLAVFFQEGNLPGSLCIVMLPLLMYWIYEYLQYRRQRALPNVSVCFSLICLCSISYAGMIVTAFLICFIIDGIIRHEVKREIHAFLAFLPGYMLAGFWLLPCLMRKTAVNTGFWDQYFQSLFLSVNPFARFQRGCEDFYFGLAVCLLAVFGIFLSKRKSMAGFWTGIIILCCTSNTLYRFLSKVPFAHMLYMLNYLSIALCMVLFSFLSWNTLKKGWVVLFAGLLALDALPSLPLVLGSQSGSLPEQRMAYYSDVTLIEKAKKITGQRLALIDENSLGAMSNYLISGYGTPTASMYGSAEEHAAALSNIRQINRALEEGNYLYLFDRCLEMGSDTVIVHTELVSSLDKTPVISMDHTAAKIGYKLTDTSEGYRLYKLDADGAWGTVTTYRAIGIGASAPEISRQFPVVEEADTTKLDDFTFDDLKDYELIYLAGFTYDDRAAAEQLITRLSESGVRIVIAADGIPEDRGSRNQSFLGVVCNPVSFSQGYPNLDTIDGVLDPDLFPSGYREWNTVYVDGLDEVWGTVEDLNWELPFYGTVKNDNIVVIGLNLSYYLSLTRDKGVEALLSHAMNLRPDEFPVREIVPYDIQYLQDQIVIDIDRDDVNTSLAWHDSFSSQQQIYAKNHLTYVKAGRTEIVLAYPWLGAGIAVSLAGIILIAVYCLRIRRQKSEKEAG